MLDGEPYDANDPELLTERARCRGLVEAFNAVPFAASDAHDRALRALLGSVGDDVTVLAPFQCDYGYHITLGPRTFINFGATVLDEAPVSIGADVLIGPGVQLITASHPLDAATRRTGEETASGIRIEDGVWLAAGVIVLPGVTIGAGAVVGAGSVVTRSLPAAHLCLGNPCRVIRPV